MVDGGSSLVHTKADNLVFSYIIECSFHALETGIPRQVQSIEACVGLGQVTHGPSRVLIVVFKALDREERLLTTLTIQFPKAAERQPIRACAKLQNLSKLMLLVCFHYGPESQNNRREASHHEALVLSILLPVFKHNLRLATQLGLQLLHREVLDPSVLYNRIESLLDLLQLSGYLFTR